jgi:hypothetical protein
MRQLDESLDKISDDVMPDKIPALFFCVECPYAAGNSFALRIPEDP